MPDDDQGNRAAAEGNAKAKSLAAETAVLNAELAHLQAKRKLAEAQAAHVPHGAAASLAAAQYAKTLADARKGEAESASALLKAKIGGIPGSSLSSAVELGEKSALIATALLASKAMSIAAETAASALSERIGKDDAVIVIFPSGQLPELKALSRWRALKQLLSTELQNASSDLASASSAPPASALPQAAQATFALPAAGLALEAASKLASYFRSDFKVAGTELGVDHAAFAELIAGKLCDKSANALIRLPSVFEAATRSIPDDFFKDELAPLATLYHQALGKLDGAEDRLLALSAELEQPADGTDEHRQHRHLLSRRMARMRAATDRLRQLAHTCNSLLDSLIADKENLDALMRPYALLEWGTQGKVFALCAKVHQLGGAHYTKKNLWTLLGTMPFHVMGGIVASYSLFDAESGNLLESQTIPVHGGFQPLKNLASFLSRSDSRSSS